VALASKTTFKQLRSELKTVEDNQSKEIIPTNPTKELTEKILFVSNSKLLMIEYVCSVSGKKESRSSAIKELNVSKFRKRFVM
jgi:hypothetical protein